MSSMLKVCVSWTNGGLEVIIKLPISREYLSWTKNIYCVSKGLWSQETSI